MGLSLGTSLGFGNYSRVLKHRQADWLGCGAISITGVIVRITRINLVARRRQLSTNRALGTSRAFSRLVRIIVANLTIDHHPILACDRDNVIVRSMGDDSQRCCAILDGLRELVTNDAGEIGNSDELGGNPSKMVNESVGAPVQGSNKLAIRHDARADRRKRAVRGHPPNSLQEYVDGASLVNAIINATPQPG